MFFFYSAALALVKEVANHANDIMKQGVRAKSYIQHILFTPSKAPYRLLISTFIYSFVFESQDNFQKLIQVQCRLNGHHEVVQPGRVRLYKCCLELLFL